MKPALDRTPTTEAIAASKKLGCAFVMLGFAYLNPV